MIRPAQVADAPVLSSVAHAAKRFWGYPEEWISSWATALTVTPDFIDRHPVYVATDANGEVAGFYALIARPERIVLEHLWVLPECIRTGVGRRLFAHAVATAASLGGRVLEIDADPNAEGFYTRMGARKVGEVPADVAGHRRVLPRLEFVIRE